MLQREPVKAPTIHDIKKMLDKTISGNDSEKLLAFTTLLTAYTGCQQFLLVRGSTSVGKNATVDPCLHLFPQEHVFTMDFSSKTAPWYEHDLTGAKILYAGELQKQQDEVKEIIKSMHSRDHKLNEGVTYLSDTVPLKVFGDHNLLFIICS